MRHRPNALRQLFGIVIVPTAVAREVAPTVTLPEWIEVRALQKAGGQVALPASLSPGEGEAIHLALETDAWLIILDDRPARRFAEAQGLSVVGTAGLLVLAKKQGVLPDVRPALDALLAHDFRIAPALYNRVLRDAGEEPQAKPPHA